MSATQIVLGYTEGSWQSSSGGEAEPVQLSTIACPNNLQSVTDTPLDLLEESERISLKLRSSGVKAEQVEALSIATPHNNQSPTDTALDFFNLSEELSLKQLSLVVKAETAASPSASDILEEVPLTLQQREAISRQHPLKFITGHYGSGKVTVSYTWNCYI